MNTLEQKKEICIKMSEPAKRIPKELHSGIAKSIGSSWKSGTTTLLKGISDLEVEYLLPNIIGVKPQSTQWEDAVEKWFANLNIKVDPITGTTLNVATSEKIVNVRDEKMTVQYPVNVVDYIKYKYCLAHKNVGNDKDIARGQKKTFYIEDKNIVREELASIREICDKIDREYLKLTEKDSEKKFIKVKSIDAIIRSFGENPLIMSDFDKIEKIESYKDNDKRQVNQDKSDQNVKFLTLVKDPDLEYKGFILACLTNNILTQRGEYIVDSDKNDIILGTSIDAAVQWLKDGANSSNSIHYKSLLQQRTQKVIS